MQSLAHASTATRVQSEEHETKDYPFFTHRLFQPVPYRRVMRWKAGEGRIVMNGKTRKTDYDNTDGEELPANQAVFVFQTNLKMSKI